MISDASYYPYYPWQKNTSEQSPLTGISLSLSRSRSFSAPGDDLRGLMLGPADMISKACLGPNFFLCSPRQVHFAQAAGDCAACGEGAGYRPVCPRPRHHPGSFVPAPRSGRPVSHYMDISRFFLFIFSAQAGAEVRSRAPSPPCCEPYLVIECLSLWP